MRFHHTLILVLFLFSLSASAFELIMIQAVSNTKKTFITRHGKRDGVSIGNTATFTAEDVSINAKAINITSNFTQWEIVNENARLPFEKGAMVTYYPANEYIWALSTEPERKKYIKSMIPTLKQSFTFRAGLSRGLNEYFSRRRVVLFPPAVGVVRRLASRQFCIRADMARSPFDFLDRNTAQGG
jgi:hypothetical protein